MRALFLTVGFAFAACAPADSPPDIEPVRLGQAVATGEACGGMMGLTCASESDFCLIPMENICGAADGMGTCTPRPEVCTQQYEPVCGCGDVTYGNACEAHAAGVSVAYEGECKA